MGIVSTTKTAVVIAYLTVIGPLSQYYVLMANALLIIDVQEFYKDDLPHDFAQRIANHVQGLSYDLVAFSVFKNQPDSNFVHSLKWTKSGDDKDCVLPSELRDLATSDNTFVRSTYSAFVDTGLHEYLQANHVDRLVLCGLDVDACVLATAFSAFDLGYHLKVETDLTFSTVGLKEQAEAIIKKSLESRD